MIRSRRPYLFALAAVVAAGLASRRFGAALPAVLSRYAGDTLWAVAVYLAAAVAWPAAPTRRIAAGTMAFACAIELSQLAHPAWLDAIRRWPGARFVLGEGFLWSDFLCYGAGVLFAAGLDALLPRRRGS
jgi:hypothetical protein